MNTFKLCKEEYIYYTWYDTPGAGTEQKVMPWCEVTEQRWKSVPDKKTARSSSGEGHSSSPSCTNYPLYPGLETNNNNNAEHTFYLENNLEPLSTDHCVPLENPPCLASLKVIT